MGLLFLNVSMAVNLTSLSKTKKKKARFLFLSVNKLCKQVVLFCSVAQKMILLLPVTKCLWCFACIIVEDFFFLSCIFQAPSGHQVITEIFTRQGKGFAIIAEWIFMKDTVSRESNGLHSPDGISYFMCTSSSTWVAEHWSVSNDRGWSKMNLCEVLECLEQGKITTRFESLESMTELKWWCFVMK